MKILIKREDEVTCQVCKDEGERLTFDDGTTWVEHPARWNEKINGYVKDVHKNG